MSSFQSQASNICHIKEQVLHRLQRCQSVSSLYLLLKEFYIPLTDEFPNYNFFRETIFHTQQETSYSSFSIPKKNSEPRLIEVPNEEIKKIQQSLNYLLTIIYEPKASVHGFVKNRNIISNAQNHCGKEYVLNIDLKDFFHSITQKKIRGTLMSPPYLLDSKIATTISHLCCYEDHLPQGAPTSPIISNIVCSKLDSELRILAQNNNCFYTRYADDITFSTTRKNFPTELCIIYGAAITDINLSQKLISIIKNNGFIVNFTKVRIQSKNNKQEVTGLTVNKKVNISRKYIRHVRAILHDWHTNGYITASMNYYSHCSSHNQKFGYLHNAVRGKIGFIGQVRNKDDYLYKKLYLAYSSLMEREVIRQRSLKFNDKYYQNWSNVIDNYLVQVVNTYIENENISVDKIKTGFDELQKLREKADPDYDQSGVPVAYTFLYLPRKIMAATAILSHYFQEYNALIPHRVLDIGSGTNAVSIALGLFRKDINISLTALEPNAWMSHFCLYQPQFPNMEITQRSGSIGSWNGILEERSYDLIFISSVLQNKFKYEAVSWWDDWTNDLYLSTSKNGQLVIVEPLVKKKDNLIQKMNLSMKKAGWLLKEELLLSDLFPNVSIRQKQYKLSKLTDLRNNILNDYSQYTKYPVSAWNTHSSYDEVIYIYQK